MGLGRVMQLIIHASLIFLATASDDYSKDMKAPTVGIAVLVRNKYHTLPYFLSCLYNLNYPKDRIYIWIHSDFNEDKSDAVLERWVLLHNNEYNGVHLSQNKSSGELHPDEEDPTQWTHMRFEHVIAMRQQAFEYFRRVWADFIFMLDADAFLTERNALRSLVAKGLEVASPMLLSDGLYSNFWCGMSEDYYYQRTEEYQPIQSWERRGCFEVPMVHSAVLVDLRRARSDGLGYRPGPRYGGPVDDIIMFAANALDLGIPMHICNDQLYGFIPVPLEQTEAKSSDSEQVLNVKLAALGRHSPFALNSDMAPFVEYPDQWRYGFGEVYLINLRRRAERRNLMLTSFKELGIAVKIVDAVDGKELNMAALGDLGVTLMPKYEDPYHKRPMKAGEVGCFLSHYNIWKDIVDQEHSDALILEDDIHFVPYFRHHLINLMGEIRDFDWDLVYLGRKILDDAAEERVSPHAARPRYSYWTLGYALSARGARKLLDARPLEHLLPVDEFLPIMFDQHPNATWKSYFPVRNLVALSASPLLLHPTHYTGQPGYVSDTEDSPVLPTRRPHPPHPDNEL